MIVLNAAQKSLFRDVSGFWVSELMQLGLVYKDAEQSKVFLSLGCFAGGGLAWELLPVDEEGKYFRLSHDGDITCAQASSKLKTFATSMLHVPGSENAIVEEFAGIPTRVCCLNSCGSCFSHQ